MTQRSLLERVGAPLPAHLSPELDKSPLDPRAAPPNGWAATLQQHEAQDGARAQAREQTLDTVTPIITSPITGTLASRLPVAGRSVAHAPSSPNSQLGVDAAGGAGAMDDDSLLHEVAAAEFVNMGGAFDVASMQGVCIDPERARVALEVVQRLLSDTTHVSPPTETVCALLPYHSQVATSTSHFLPHWT